MVTQTASRMATSMGLTAVLAPLQDCRQQLNGYRLGLNQQGFQGLGKTLDSTAAPINRRFSKLAKLGCVSQLAAGTSVTSKQTEVSPGDLDVANQREQLNSMGGVMTDATVPEGHKGLHGFLYGEGGADVHDSKTGGYHVRAGEDDGTEILPFNDWVVARETEKPAGVYAIYDKSSMLQYVGYSRNIVLSLKAHMRRVGEDRCAFVRVKVYAEGAMMTRAILESERASWLEGVALPPGNGTEQGLWDGTEGVATSAMSEQERHDYEEKKLKMRKAMGENLYDDVAGEDEDSKVRRLRLLQATEGDDWSAVIDGQTQATLRTPAVADAAATAVPSQAAEAGMGPAEPVRSQIVSPFMRPNAPEVGSSSDVEVAFPALTVANVDVALDDVRPYLIADGGNVEVVGVEDGIIAVRLQGACGTCPSSTATMKMGIERALRGKFGDALKEVVQVDKQNMSATVESINAHLDILRPAIRNYGGNVEAASVDSLRGSCEVKYQGPAPIGMGIQAAIKDKFPDMKEVKLVEF